MKLFNFLIFFLIVTLSACSLNNNELELPVTEVKQIPVYGNGEIIDYIDASSLREVTDSELKELFKLGWLSPNDFYEKGLSCQWSDGVGGSVECDGGDCAVVFHNNPDGSTSAGIACYQNGQIDHAGAFR